MAGPHPYFWAKDKIVYFSKLFLCRVAYDLERFVLIFPDILSPSTFSKFEGLIVRRTGILQVYIMLVCVGNLWLTSQHDERAPFL